VSAFRPEYRYYLADMQPGSAPRILIVALVVGAFSLPGHAQSTSFGRLPLDRLNAVAPSARVAGTPGNMTVRQTTCRTVPATDVRRRLVALAVQEWAFFGFSVIDRLTIEEPDGESPDRWRRRRLDPVESARVAPSIAGYWTATPEAHWVLGRQNQVWSGPEGIAERWQYPWSAAFVSWLMCEGGLGGANQFQRAAAHHVYIDQAIQARQIGTRQGAFVAYDVGEATIEPGDLLCSARRPAYRSIAERVRQMGQGARTHCDLIVGVDAAARRMLAIGGNVRSAVSLKLLPAVVARGTARPTDQAFGGRSRLPFVHLKLRAPSIEPDALERTPTFGALGCTSDFPIPSQLTAANLGIPKTSCAD
jgi:hypothetical protein